MRKYLKLSELETLIHVSKRLRDRLIIRLLYETGMRVGELTALKIGDIDFELGEISIQHAKRHAEGRKVPLVNELTLAMLNEYIRERMNDKQDPVFVSNMHGALSRRGVEHMITKRGMSAGLERELCHPHILRHTHAVYALKAGIDLRTLQLNLGHADIATTVIYLGMDINDRKEIYSRHPLPLMEGHQARKPETSLDLEKESTPIDLYEAGFTI